MSSSGLAAAPAEQPGILNPFDSGVRIRAVLFDLDGTLYRQGAMRFLMALELATLAVTGPRSALGRWRALSEYRKAQETLRSKASMSGGTDDQVQIASQRSGVPPSEVRAIVNEWMIERPLKYLPLCRPRGLDAFLDFLDAQHLQMGILSDYPAEAKLEALGLRQRFSPILWTGDPDVAALKPSPRGFLVACQRWRLTPREVLMVGDRPEVDAAGATAAGMPSVIISAVADPASAHPALARFRSFERLHRVLAHGC
jgi:HAD superfamily hydrolase (TIGR01509 family)